jgi:hypothetical protein
MHRDRDRVLPKVDTGRDLYTNDATPSGQSKQTPRHLAVRGSAPRSRDYNCTAMSKVTQLLARPTASLTARQTTYASTLEVNQACLANLVGSM